MVPPNAESGAPRCDQHQARTHAVTSCRLRSITTTLAPGTPPFSPSPYDEQRVRDSRPGLTIADGAVGHSSIMPQQAPPRPLLPGVQRDL